MLSESVINTLETLPPFDSLFKSNLFLYFDESVDTHFVHSKSSSSTSTMHKIKI